jgi:molecular chaperone HtpG
LLASMKEELGEHVADVRASDRLTDSPVCLVASDAAPDRQLERLLAATGRIQSAAKPILEINPQHKLIIDLAGISDETMRADTIHLLFDTAKVLDGEQPADAKKFSERMSRMFARSLG